MESAPAPTLADQFPEVVRPLLPALFAEPAVSESRATCDACAMAEPAMPEPAKRPRRLVVFRADTKCCTFHPRLPNYLVGAILCDDAPEMAEGRRRIEARIAARTGVVPGWIAPSRKYSLLLSASRRSSFGRSLALRCPYYAEEAGNCSIWRYRETDCSTFFCKYDAGVDGQAFWRALAAYMYKVEGGLSAYALEQVAPELEAPRLPRELLSREELEDLPPAEADYDAWWGDWAGREADLYRACYAAVRDLSPEAFARRMDADVPREALATLEARHRAMLAPRLPTRVKVNDDLVSFRLDDATWMLHGPSNHYDPLPVPDAVFGLLDVIDGRDDLDAMKARLLADHDAALDDATILVLLRMGVLVDA